MRARWHKITKYPEIIILTGVAAVTHLWGLFRPDAVVFDEVYFKAFAAHYLDGRYFFDIHPPLAKLLLAGWGKLLGLSADTILNGTAVTLRVLPALAGILIIPVFWGILRRLGVSRKFAFVGALALTFENALLVESRFILMDSLLLLFGLSAVYCYLVFQQTRLNRRWFWLILAAVCAGAAMSTKWTGLTALAILCIMWLGDFVTSGKPRGKQLLELAALILIPLIIYAGTFALHFQLLTHSGDGDAFMSAKYQATLVGNPNYSKTATMSFPERFIELNIEMYKANQSITQGHPYGSRWYTWPFEIRPIYYWQSDTLANGKQGNIYLLGNPIVWWGVVFFAILGLAVVLLTRPKLNQSTRLGLSLLAVAYLLNFIPFMAVTRVMFIYHYFYSFIFSVAAVCLLWDGLTESLIARGEITRQGLMRTLTAICCLIILGFVYFAPLSYGWPLSPSDLQQHMWLKSWR